MRENDRQLGWPFREYRDTKANVEGLGMGAADEGCIAYATDIDEFGRFSGVLWRWGGLPDVADTGYALVSDGVNSWAVDRTPLWEGEHSFNAGIAFVGLTTKNSITIPDAQAQALHIIDAGGTEFLRLDTDAQSVTVFNFGEADIDFQVAASGVTNALFVQGSNGYVGIGGLPLYPLHMFRTTDWMVASYESADAVGSGFLLTATGAGGRTYTFISTANAAGAGGGKCAIYDSTGAVYRWVIDSAGDSMFGGVAPLAQLHVDQSSATGAQPVLYLDQADVDVEFTRYAGTAAAADLTRSLVDEGDQASETREGWLKIYVTDAGGQIGAAAYFVPFYSLSA